MLTSAGHRSRAQVDHFKWTRNLQNNPKEEKTAKHTKCVQNQDTRTCIIVRVQWLGLGSQQLVLAIIIMLVVVVGLSSLSLRWCGGAAIIIGLVAVIVCSGLDGGADMMLGWCWCC